MKKQGISMAGSLAGVAVLVLLMAAPSAFADGTTNVTVSGGAGTVTGESKTDAGNFGLHPPKSVTPGEIDCDEGGGPICSSQAQGEFFTSVRVTLTAAPDPGELFVGWTQSGASQVLEGCQPGPGADPICVIKLNGVPGPTANVAAEFKAGPTTADLDIVKSGTGTGTVTSIPSGINCGVDCSKTYPLGVEVTLSAIPGSSSGFSGWSGGGCSGTGSCVVNLNADTTVTASFDITPSASTDGAGPGPASHLATLEGRVNPNGAALTDCRFVYGPTTAYGKSTPCVPDAAGIGTGADFVPVTTSTEPLEPNTTYHFRLRASNLGGTGQGKDRTFTTGPAPPDDCPNADIRAAQGIEVLLLPDCMALEQVSPPQKGNQPAFQPDRLSPGGGRVTFSSIATIGESPNRSGLNGDPFLATRGSSGWGVHGLQGPLESPASFAGVRKRSFSPDLSQWFSGEASSRQLFHQGIDFLSPFTEELAGGNFLLKGASADHSRAYISSVSRSDAYLPGDPVPAGVGQDFNIYVAALDAAGNPKLVLLARDGDDKAWGGNCGARLGGMEQVTGSNNLPNGERNQGAISPDGTRVYFSTRPGQPDAGNCSQANKKRIMVREEATAGAEIEELIASECGALPRACPGIGTGTLASGSKLVTNISVAGGAFETGMAITATSGIPANTRIAQVLSPSELELSDNATTSASGVALRANDGDDVYQGASLDQSLVYFTTTRQLLDSDLDGSVALNASASCSNTVARVGCDLYLYDADRPAGDRLIHVSAGDDGAETPGMGAAVQNSITAISADGSHVYFVAQTKLTGDQSPEGEEAEAGKHNLYLYKHEDGDLAFVTVLDPSDDLAPGGLGLGSNGLFGRQANWENFAYPVPVRGSDGDGGDGHILLFASLGRLTSDDSDSHYDLYRYDAEAETLERISKAGPGGEDNGPFHVRKQGRQGNSSSGTDFAETRRWASEDGETALFKTAEALLPGDVNGAEDLYLWRSGEIYRMPGGMDAPGAKENEVALSGDGTTIAYHSLEQLAASDGDSAQDVYVARVNGGFPIQTKSVCRGEACQGAPATVSPDVGAASAGFAGRGNVREPRNCRAAAQRARAVAQRAKRLRAQARRAKAPARAKRLRKRAKRFGKRANNLSRNAKRCRQANRGAGR